jgi:hypothetical protein
LLPLLALGPLWPPPGLGERGKLSVLAYPWTCPALPYLQVFAEAITAICKALPFPRTPISTI